MGALEDTERTSFTIDVGDRSPSWSMKSEATPLTLSDLTAAGYEKLGTVSGMVVMIVMVCQTLDLVNGVDGGG